MNGKCTTFRPDVDELDCGNFKGRELTARRFCPQVSVSLVALAAACLAPSIAWAIGPQYQVVGDPVPAGAGQLNDVASLYKPDFGENGTGAVIGQTTPDADGDVDFAILTANHVAISGVNEAYFGVGPGEPTAPGAGPYLLGISLTSYVTFALPGAPGGATEDLSIMQGEVDINTLTPNQLAEYNQLIRNDITLTAAFSTLVPAAYSTNSVSPVPFTEMGYGTAGIWNSDTKTYQPIAPQPDDARRFQNNSINTVFGNSIVGRYYEPLVQWNYAAPSAAGGGASFGGDSGGPYLTGTTGATYQATSVSVTPSFTNNVGSMNPTNPLPQVGRSTFR